MTRAIYFADTAYWIGLINPKDSYHHKAVEVTKTLGSASLVTSESVLAETLNAFSATGRFLRNKAYIFVKRLYIQPHIDIVLQNHTLFRRALDKYGQYEDKEWGLVDCASFVIMDDYFITDALTTDHHFVQAGFNALMREQ